MRDYENLLNECMAIQHKLRHRARVVEMALDMATEFLGELFGPGALLGPISASKEEWRESLLKAAEEKLATESNTTPEI